MAVDPVSAGLGAVSLISGKNANKSARNEANQAGQMSKALEQRVIKLWDVMFARAQQAEAGGEFDPERRIAALEKDTGRYESRDMGNLAGALRVSGYKQGDSEIGTRLDAVKGKYRSFLDTMRNEIRDKSWWDQQNAYASASPGMLNAPMQSVANRRDQALGQIQNPAGFLGGFLQNLRGLGVGGGGGGGFNIAGRRPGATRV